MGFDRVRIAALCRKWGPSVSPLPAGVDGAQVLWALAGNESSFGVSTKPRHEPAFDKGGAFYSHSVAQQKLVLQFGSDAACSWGPWQIMFCNLTPPDYATRFDDPDYAASQSVGFLNHLLWSNKPRSLAEIGSCWNAGHVQHPFSAAVEAYAKNLAANYSVVMP